MNSLITILENYSFSTVLVLFILFILSLFGIYETVLKVKALFEKYHTNASNREHEASAVDSRIDNLEKSNEELKQTIEELKKGISELKDNINVVTENQHRANRATSRSAMYRLSSELIAKGWMSQTEYDTLSDLTDVFMMSAIPGAASYVRPSLVQRALNLPVLTDEEVENIKHTDAK